MLRSCCWATAVPIFPGEVPMTAEGLCAKEFLPEGRLAQSIAFLSAPGRLAVVLRRHEEHAMAGLDALS